MRFIKSEVYFPLIVGAHLALWGIDLAMHKGALTLFAGESAAQRVAGEVFSSWVVTVFAFNLLMATRARWVERIFGGLDKMYLIHRRSGIIAVALLLLHFAVVPRSPEFTPGKPLGFAAMVLILLGVAMAFAPFFRRKLPYHKWVKSHRLMGVFYVLGIVHSLLVPTLISQLPLVRSYVYGMAALGVAAWFYKAFLHSRLRRPKQFCVTEVRRSGQASADMLMRPEEGPLPHLPGQFAFFSFPGMSDPEAHPFTIAGGEDGALRIAVKVSGDFTSELVERLEVGAPVLVEGPYGHFTAERIGGQRQVWVAGGIGITPFLALGTACSGGPPIHLFWSVRTKDEAFFDEELSRLAESHSNLEYTLWVSNERGYLSSDDLPIAEDTQVLICGPAPLREGLVKGLRAMGIPQAQIHNEEFAFR